MLGLICSHAKYVDEKVADELWAYDSDHPAITVNIWISDKPNNLEYNTLYNNFKRGDDVLSNIKDIIIEILELRIFYKILSEWMYSIFKKSQFFQMIFWCP